MTTKRIGSTKRQSGSRNTKNTPRPERRGTATAPTKPTPRSDAGAKRRDQKTRPHAPRLQAAVTKREPRFQARHISKTQVDRLRKCGGLQAGVLVDYFKGFLIVEPVGSNLGDGDILAPEVADYELRPVWCLMPLTRLSEARRRLGLEVAVSGTHASAG